MTPLVLRGDVCSCMKHLPGATLRHYNGGPAPPILRGCRHLWEWCKAALGGCKREDDGAQGHFLPLDPFLILYYISLASLIPPLASVAYQRIHPGFSSYAYKFVNYSDAGSTSWS